MPSDRIRRWKARAKAPSYLREDTPEDVRMEVEALADTPPENRNVIVHLPGDYATEEMLLLDLGYAVREARRDATGSEEPPLPGYKSRIDGVDQGVDWFGAMYARARALAERTGIPTKNLYAWMITGRRPSVSACYVDAPELQCDPDGEPFTFLTLRFTRPPTAREMESIRKEIREAIGPKGRLTPEQRLLVRVVESTIEEDERKGYRREPWERVRQRMIGYGANRKGYRAWAEQYKRAQKVLDADG